MDVDLAHKTLDNPGFIRKPRILVAPLDWGLGHATRCIPLVRELIAQGVDVWLAGEGAQEHLLKEEFPTINFLHLPGYRVGYAKTAGGLLWKMIWQAPKIQKAIRDEYKWLKEMVSKYHFDAVISDNRYGLYHRDIPCVIITHQLSIKTPAGKWTDRLLQKKNYKYIERFTECWIPDIEGEKNLAGDLSHPRKLPLLALHYTGLLSRFTYSGVHEKKEHLLIIISGPEPQRSVFERLVIEGVSHYPGTATVVRGLPGSQRLIPSTNMIQFFNHLPTKDLNEEMLKAKYIISRSGYSTVMDAMQLRKKCIFVPTPGQTEQEYLAKKLNTDQIACMLVQKNFTIDAAITAAEQFNYQIPESETGTALQNRVRALLQLCSSPAFG